ncbi:MAG: hypothetical protein [Caudoviricetes sp.]|nr:MAG: hypothetical protein [Caudoviricetes sp.]
MKVRIDKVDSDESSTISVEIEDCGIHEALAVIEQLFPSDEYPVYQPASAETIH